MLSMIKYNLDGVVIWRTIISAVNTAAETGSKNIILTDTNIYHLAHVVIHNTSTIIYNHHAVAANLPWVDSNIDCFITQYLVQLTKYTLDGQIVWRTGMGDTTTGATIGENPVIIYNNYIYMNMGRGSHRNSYIYNAIPFNLPWSNTIRMEIPYTSVGSGSAFIYVKYDINGQVIWRNHFICSGTHKCKFVISDGNIYVAAPYSQISAKITNAIFGNNVWSDGAFVTLPTSTKFDVAIIKYNINGEFIWRTRINSLDNIYINEMNVISDSIYIGGLYVVADINIHNAVFGNAAWSDSATILPISTAPNTSYIIKYNLSGVLLWRTRITIYVQYLKFLNNAISYNINIHNSISGTNTWSDTTNVFLSNTLSNLVTYVGIVKYNIDGGIIWRTKIDGTTHNYIQASEFTDNNLYISILNQTYILNYIYNPVYSNNTWVDSGVTIGEGGPKNTLFRYTDGYALNPPLGKIKYIYSTSDSVVINTNNLLTVGSIVSNTIQCTINSKIQLLPVNGNWLLYSSENIIPL